MMPLAMSKAGDELMVARVGGNEEAKKHLEDLGFVAGAHITIISQLGDGNIIVNVKESGLLLQARWLPK